MQPLINLTNADRAKLLFQLFPGEIPAFIVFEKIYAEILIRDQKQIEKEWKNDKGPFTFEFWLSMAQDAIKTIEENDTEIATRSSRFSFLLFEGFNCFFTMDSLRQFARSGKCTNPKFIKAI